MAIIVRPTKSNGSTDFVAGDDVLAEEFNGDANTLYNDYNGNIIDANCSPIMGLQGSKLANAPNGITKTKINTGAITGDKLSLVTESVAFSYDFAPYGPIGIMFYRGVSGSNYICTVLAQAFDVTGPNPVNHFITVTPTTPIPTASRILLGLYLDNVVFGVTTISGNVVFISIASS